MQLSLDQIAEMAPDASSASAGKKLMAPKNWTDLGHSAEALWGKCQGSALYQVRVDEANLGYSCSCPSRKFPCKHVLGLLMLYAATPAAVAETSAPDWVQEWLEKRRQREEKQAEKAAEPKKPVDEAAQAKRAAKRESSVCDGIDRLDLWLKDLIRNGLAAVETKPGIWEEQAKRLVDAQAPGLASRVSRLEMIPRSTPDWPQRLLGELGHLKLILHAYRRIDQLEPSLQSELRQIIGWNVDKDELDEAGEKVEDTWIVHGQWTDDDDRIRSQRSWLVGRHSGRHAFVLQFAPGKQVFPESILPGTEQTSTVVFYPGAVPYRARFLKRGEGVSPVRERIPGAASIETFVDLATGVLEQQPWCGAFGAVLHDVTLVPHNNSWLVRDAQGHGLPLEVRGNQVWKILALTGGHPFDVCGQWDGRQFRALGLLQNATYRVV